MLHTNRDSMLQGGKPDIRFVHIGGRTGVELLADLKLGGIKLNGHAQTLLKSSRFQTAATPHRLTVVIVNVRDLGLPQGAGIRAIHTRAIERRLCLCPMEVAPHFRLQYPDQPEGFIGHPATRQTAPPGSITVACEPIDSGDGFPKGFYLRRIEGALWLRGYCSDNEHIWNPDDFFAFCQI